MSSETSPIPSTEAALIRHDLESARLSCAASVAWRGGRAVFVPRRNDAAEEDRWLLALVYSGESDASSLQILDASDLPGEPAAIVEHPERVLVGFHGNWVPDLV